MRRRVILFFLTLSVGMLFPRTGQAATGSSPPVHLTYRGGPLIQNPQVSILFWGPTWPGKRLVDYLSTLFPALFRDGRFMKSLEEYSTGKYHISNGTSVASATDDAAPPATVTDSQIRAEIQAQVAAGHLPKPSADSVYVVFIQPGSTVIDRSGRNSTTFGAYHDCATGSDPYAYAVVPYHDSYLDPTFITFDATGIFAAAVTDPDPTRGTLGWYDEIYGEVEAIPQNLVLAGQLKVADIVDWFWDVYGMQYAVAKVWSNRANAPVGLTPLSSSQ